MKDEDKNDQFKNFFISVQMFRSLWSWILFFCVLMNQLEKIEAGPITAYSSCSLCCGAVHATDWIVPIYGAGSTGVCILEACVNPLPGLCVDPRDNVCVAVFLSTLVLPSP